MPYMSVVCSRCLTWVSCGVGVGWEWPTTVLSHERSPWCWTPLRQTTWNYCAKVGSSPHKGLCKLSTHCYLVMPSRAWVFWTVQHSLLHSVMSPDTGVMSPDRGVMSPDRGVMLPDRGVMSPDTGVMSPDTGVMSPDRCNVTWHRCNVTWHRCNVTWQV